MKRSVPILLFSLAAGVLLPAVGCVNVHVDPIEMTLNVNVRVQKEVDKAFDYLYGGDVGAPPAPPTQPTTGM
jgi:hypothetical protein